MEDVLFPPVVIFAYKRVRHLEQCVNSLLTNAEASQVDVVIYCDGPRGPADEQAVNAVREYASQVSGFKSVQCVLRPFNIGLAASVVSGVSDLLERSDSIVVLEDDMVTSRFFLKYMFDALETYRNDHSVSSIHGWSFPHSLSRPPHTFFLRGADCWGWATWSRAWKLYRPDASALLDEILARNLSYSFDLDGSYGYTEMLRAARDGKVDSWAIRWHASTFLAGLFTLHPGRSMVQNIGLDSSGTHCGSEPCYSVPLAQEPVVVDSLPVKESLLMRESLKLFYRKHDSRSAFRRQIKSLVKQVLPPVVTSSVRALVERLRSSSVRWEGNYRSWGDAIAESSGYDAPDIFVKVCDSARAVRDGNALWERDSVCFYHEEHNFPVVSALVSVAAWNGGKLSVLDFGGAFGSTCWQHMPLFERLQSLAWHIVEQPHVVAVGRKEFGSYPLQFWNSVDECAAHAAIDVVLLSGVLQYLEDPYVFLDEIIARKPSAIVIDRTPLLEAGERIAVQYVPPHIYAASYPCRWLNKRKISGKLEDYYTLGPWWDSRVDPAGFQGVFCYR